jgi:hypothetical protein
MTIKSCTRQPEVKAVLESGHWPHACPPELRAHLSDCRSCADLVLVTQAFRQSRAATAAQAQLPAPGAIWWRAQLRRRNAAIESVGKPILGAYVFALAFTLVVAFAVVSSLVSHKSHWFDWLTQSAGAGLHAENFSPSAWLSLGGGLAVLIPVFAMVALVGAVVVYVSTERQ